MAESKSQKITKLVAAYKKAGKIKFKDKVYPIFPAIKLPLIEDVAYWVEKQIQNKNVQMVGKKVPMSFIKIGELYWTSAKQLWVVTQVWFQNENMYMTARKLYPRKGEDNRLFSQAAEKGSKSSLSVNVKKVNLKLIDSNMILNNIEQLTKKEV